MNLLREQRATWESQTYQAWLVSLQHAPKKAQNLWRQRESDTAQANRRLLAALRAMLPPSVRPLLGVAPLAVSVGKAGNIIDWWDRQLEAIEPGTRYHAFISAGRQAAVERSRKRVH